MHQYVYLQSKAKERSFSWFYLCCNVGSLLGESGMPVLRQSVGFIVAWLTVFGKSTEVYWVTLTVILNVLFFCVYLNSIGSTSISTVLFLAGTCFYIKKKPQRINCCRSYKKVCALNI